MEQLNLFRIPMFKFKNENHAELKNTVFPFLSNPELFVENTNNGAHLHFTSPELHKMELFKSFTDFTQSCLEQTMTAMGYLPNVQITSLWATKHIENGAHHRHSHGNSFLVGVYYLSGEDSGAQKVAGTRFFNPNRMFGQIMPARSAEKPALLQTEFNNPFTEGTLIIFPAWLEHTTMPNRTGVHRYILGVNSMPLGLTNTDQFDRFNYQDVSNVEMISSKKQRFDYKP